MLTNCAEYLADHPRRGRFEIDNPSAWSCAHGVERWQSNCGCRLDPNTSQEWRGPLRDAMLFIKDHADAVYDRFAPPLVDDPMAALREAMRLFVDDSPITTEQFFARHKVKEEAKRDELLRLLEMERAAHATLTSCAWFFDDFAGPEGRICCVGRRARLNLPPNSHPTSRASCCTVCVGFIPIGMKSAMPQRFT